MAALNLTKFLIFIHFFGILMLASFSPIPNLKL